MPRILLALTAIAAMTLPVAAQDAPKQLAASARTVLRQYCHRCHHGTGSDGGFEWDVLKHSDLVKTPDYDKPLVIAGKPEESLLVERAVRRKNMPPRKHPEQPSAADRETLEKWVKAGAPAFEVTTAAARKPVTLTDVLTAVRDHLAKARDNRDSLRFFTLHHLHNNPELSDDDLNLVRAALSKSLNSLHDRPRVVLPRAVDAAQTVFFVDVADLGWDRDKRWNAVLEAYPYGLRFRNHPDRALRDLDQDITNLNDSALPLVRADWFIATATRPPLYHALLRSPKNARDLEKQLDVDIAANFLDPRPERIARAAFAKSGVSGQNRLVERSEAKHGSYWKSYDFKPDTGRAKLTRFPLGPLNLFAEGKHPHAAQAFVHDGGEIIFSLPNGLQGYLLVNGKDERIDEGPIQVVGDALKTSGTPAIVTGVSCMACHKHGMIGFKDTLRTGNAVFGEAEEKVRRLYPEQSEMDKLVEQDESQYLKSLEKAVGPFLRAGANAKKPLREFAEPVGEVARTYRLGYLDLKDVARELDVADPKQITDAVGRRGLKELGLEGLLDGGVVSRLEWEAVDGVSLMQALARKLRYTPSGR